MHELRLLERIAALESRQERRHLTQAQVLVGSIIEHLRRILNTRQGSVPIDGEFGVPDFTNLAGSFVRGETEQIILAMNRMVIRYEPRLLGSRISLQHSAADELALSFILDARVMIDDQAIPISLATRVSSEGRVSLMRH